jgi:hypothetical protein
MVAIQISAILAGTRQKPADMSYCNTKRPDITGFQTGVPDNPRHIICPTDSPDRVATIGSAPPGSARIYQAQTEIYLSDRACIGVSSTFLSGIHNRARDRL